MTAPGHNPHFASLPPRLLQPLLSFTVHHQNRLKFRTLAIYENAPIPVFPFKTRMMADLPDEREEELSSLTAIFPEIEFMSDDPYSFSFEIPVTPNEPLEVRFSLPDDVQTLSHLPSILLQMTLPVGYPDEISPVVHLSTKPPWIPAAKIEELEGEATRLWEDYGHAQMAYDYIDSLNQAAECVFDLHVDGEGFLDLDPGMKTALLAHNAAAAKKLFDAGTFDCEVCLDPRKGVDCHRMHNCDHVFCVDCLRAAYDAAIAEGDVASVKCLGPDCGVERDAITKRAAKAAPTLGPDELLHISIPRAAVDRYVKLKRKKRFESFPKTVYCPRKWCQGIARARRYPKKPLEQMTADDLDPEVMLSEQDAEPKDLPLNKDLLRLCEDCDLAFCRVCLATWHGNYAPRCWPRSTEELTEDDQATYNYLRQHTTPCPTCDFAVQKSMGCNHITCFNCRNHFCYLCSEWLNPGDPYAHYSKKDTSCYQRLWDLEGGDNLDGNIEFLGIRGAEAAALAAEEAELAELRQQQA